jgi:hypothetical protein
MRAHPIADFDFVDRAADLGDDAHVLVTEHATGLHVGATLVHVEIGAADVGSHDPHERVLRTLDLGIRYASDLDVTRSVVDDCLHRFSLAHPDMVTSRRALREHSSQSVARSRDRHEGRHTV